MPALALRELISSLCLFALTLVATKAFSLRHNLLWDIKQSGR
jgi:hypothetical protein